MLRAWQRAAVSTAARLPSSRHHAHVALRATQATEHLHCASLHSWSCLCARRARGDTAAVDASTPASSATVASTLVPAVARTPRRASSSAVEPLAHGESVGADLVGSSPRRRRSPTTAATAAAPTRTRVRSKPKLAEPTTQPPKEKKERKTRDENREPTAHDLKFAPIRIGAATRTPQIHYPVLRAFLWQQSIGEHTGDSSAPDFSTAAASSSSSSSDAARIPLWWKSKRLLLPRAVLNYFSTEYDSVATFRSSLQRRLRIMSGDLTELGIRGRPNRDLLQPSAGVTELAPNGTKPEDVDLSIAAQRALDTVYAACRAELVQLGLWHLLEVFDAAKVDPIPPLVPGTPSPKGRARSPTREHKNARFEPSDPRPTPEEVDQTRAPKPMDAMWRAPPIANPWQDWSFQMWADLAGTECKVREAWLASGSTGRPELPDLSSSEDQQKLREAIERGRISPYTAEGRAQHHAHLPPLLPSALEFDIRDAVVEMVELEPKPKTGKAKGSFGRLEDRKHPPGPILFTGASVDLSTLNEVVPKGAEFRIDTPLEWPSLSPQRAEAKHAPMLFLRAHQPLQQRVRDQMVRVRIGESALLSAIREERKRDLTFRVNPIGSVAAPSDATNQEQETETAAELEMQEDDDESRAGGGAIISPPSSTTASSSSTSSSRSYSLAQFGTAEFRIDHLFALLAIEEHRLSLLSRAYTLELETKRREVARIRPEVAKLLAQDAAEALAIKMERDRKKEERLAAKLAVAARKAELVAHAKTQGLLYVKRLQSRQLMDVREVMETMGCSAERAREIMAERGYSSFPETPAATETDLVDAQLDEQTGDLTTTHDLDAEIDDTTKHTEKPDVISSPTTPAPVIAIVANKEEIPIPMRGSLLQQGGGVISSPTPSDETAHVTVPLVVTLDKTLTVQYLRRFLSCTNKIQSLEDAIREFVRQKKAEGTWEQAIERRVAERAMEKKPPSTAVTPEEDDDTALEAQRSGFFGSHSERERVTSSYNRNPLVDYHAELTAMPLGFADLFLDYRARRAIPYSIFDDVTNLPEEEAARSQAQPKSLPEALAKIKSRIFTPGTVNKASLTVPPPTSSSDPTPVFELPVLGRAARRKALDTETKIIFDYHLLHLNPAVTTEMRRVMDLHENQAQAPILAQAPTHDASHYEHFTRPASIRAGFMPLFNSLAVCMLPEALVKHETAIRLFPWLLWDTWRLLLQSSYLRVFPDAFGVRRPISLSTQKRRLKTERMKYAAHANADSQAVNLLQSGAQEQATTVDPASADDFILRMAARNSELRQRLDEQQAQVSPSIPKAPLSSSALAHFVYLQRKYAWATANANRRHQEANARLPHHAREDHAVRFERRLAINRRLYLERIAEAEQHINEEQLARLQALVPVAQKTIVDIIDEGALRDVDLGSGFQQALGPATPNSLGEVVALLRVCLRVPHAARQISSQPLPSDSADATKADIESEPAVQAERLFALRQLLLGATSFDSPREQLQLRVVEYTDPSGQAVPPPIDMPRFLLTVTDLTRAQLKFAGDSICRLVSIGVTNGTLGFASSATSSAFDLVGAQMSLDELRAPSSSGVVDDDEVDDELSLALGTLAPPSSLSSVLADAWLSIDLGQIVVHAFTGAPRFAVEPLTEQATSLGLTVTLVDISSTATADADATITATASALPDAAITRLATTVQAGFSEHAAAEPEPLFTMELNPRR